MICVGALAARTKNTRERLDAVRARVLPLALLQPPPMMHGHCGKVKYFVHASARHTRPVYDLLMTTRDVISLECTVHFPYLIAEATGHEIRTRGYPEQPRRRYIYNPCDCRWCYWRWVWLYRARITKSDAGETACNISIFHIFAQALLIRVTLVLRQNLTRNLV